MAQYLLVHGAWHGAWCWQHVSEGLIRAGHSAHALTLTGLGERSHLLHRGIDLETHVQDVLQALDAQEMQDAILVEMKTGHDPMISAPKELTALLLAYADQ